MTCVDTMYKSMVSDSRAFSDALHNFVFSQHGNLKPPSHDSSGPTLTGLLTLLDIVFDMFNDVGLVVIFSTYTSIKIQETIDFEPACGWNLCCFSRLPSKNCVHVGGGLTANCRYLKWLQCMWIVTHIKETENIRSAVAHGERHRIPHDACELYRLAFSYLLEELERLHASVRVHSNEVFVRMKPHK